MRGILIALALVSSTAACATAERQTPHAAAPDASATRASATRGLYLALHTCAACHAVGALGESPDGVAPSFAVLRLRANELSLERQLSEISRRGHHEMPSIPMTADEIKDIVAYMQTVGPPARASQSPGGHRQGAAV